LGFPAAEVADDVAAPLLTPADQLLVGHHGPVLAGFAVKRVVVCPLLGVRLEARVGDLAAALVPGAVHRGEVAVASPAALNGRAKLLPTSPVTTVSRETGHVGGGQLQCFVRRPVLLSTLPCAGRGAGAPRRRPSVLRSSSSSGQWMP